MEKYELIKEKDTGLYRVKALIDIPIYSVAIRDLGGYVSGENNLSDKGDVWVSGKARVLGNAYISGSVQVAENAKILENARVSGTVQAYGDALVSGNAQVSGNVWISGNARIFGDAIVSGNAQVFGDAIVSGNAQVKGHVQVLGYTRISGDALITSNRDFITLGPIGSRDDYVTAYRTKDGSFGIATGCFVGSLEEFRDNLNDTHEKDSIYWKDYTNMCRFVEIFFQ